ncbi:VOC family protein [Streptomyces sp. NPDC048604]|uniref:VOC family protein n=1 Tax=Streptomyces sp. NPDC048604 TaxID=3365578 RepID=UPI003718E982
MLGDSKTFGSFSVDSIDTVRDFYASTLGLRVAEEKEMDVLLLKLAGDRDVVVYPKENHEPASFTVLNFVVDDIGKTVDDLVARGVTFERYEQFTQDDKGIMRDEGAGPAIAWFKDPAGNVLAVMEDPGQG